MPKETGGALEKVPLIITKASGLQRGGGEKLGKKEDEGDGGGEEYEHGREKILIVPTDVPSNLRFKPRKRKGGGEEGRSGGSKKGATGGKRKKDLCVANASSFNWKGERKLEESKGMAAGPREGSHLFERERRGTGTRKEGSRGGGRWETTRGKEEDKEAQVQKRCQDVKISENKEGIRGKLHGHKDERKGSSGKL